MLIERWRVHYNTVRPHSSLGYRPPAPDTWQIAPPLAGCTPLGSLAPLRPPTACAQSGARLTWKLDQSVGEGHNNASPEGNEHRRIPLGNTKPEWIGKGRTDEADALRFAPHAAYIEDNRDELIEAVPQRLRVAGGKILDLMLKFHGRVAANQIYHGIPTPICTFRNWRVIRDVWKLATMVEYVMATKRDM